MCLDEFNAMKLDGNKSTIDVQDRPGWVTVTCGEDELVINLSLWKSKLNEFVKERKLEKILQHWEKPATKKLNACNRFADKQSGTSLTCGRPCQYSHHPEYFRMTHLRVANVREAVKTFWTSRLDAQVYILRKCGFNRTVPAVTLALDNLNESLRSALDDVHEASFTELSREKKNSSAATAPAKNTTNTVKNPWEPSATTATATATVTATATI